jgi:hypothetical protein
MYTIAKDEKTTNAALAMHSMCVFCRASMSMCMVSIIFKR